jgi:hypothetical protein
LFAFTWTDPDSLLSQQLTLTVLPQGFRDSPQHFGQALQHDLQSLDLHPSRLIQYRMTFSYIVPPDNFAKHTPSLSSTLLPGGDTGYQNKRPN